MRRAPSSSPGIRNQSSALLLFCALLGISVYVRAADLAQEQRLPRQTAGLTAAIEGIVLDPDGRGIVGANIVLLERDTGRRIETTGSGDGVFRTRDVLPGTYDLRVTAPGYDPLERDALALDAGKIVTLQLMLHVAPGVPQPASRLPRAPELGPPSPPVPETTLIPYGGILPHANVQQVTPEPQMLPPASDVFLTTPNRWNVAMPPWNRYGRPGEYAYVQSHWWDPFDRSKLKGDVPIFGQQTFLNFTGTSTTELDGRRLPTPSGVSTENPGSPEFFGKGGQFFLSQTFRFSFDLFHGDTSFRPVDWRIRVTPAVNLNYLKVRELGIVNPDVLDGTQRFDAHIGLQEALVEVKLRDLSANYDFFSVRGGIQEFNSDFRGFLLVEEQPGMRVFGTLDSNRWQYNAAYFYFLEKDTNSGLNTFAPRHQQVYLANFYRQDFVRPGYTAQFSIHYNKDDASVHYDDNDFLVRPAPIGSVQPHSIRAVYLGWTGDGHLGPLNISHAFYQALGRDDFNPIAGRPVTINAQMAAAEVSLDRDWMRFRLSSFYASGDGNPRGGEARGFDAIDDAPDFAGGIFSFWNREAIPLTRAGVELTPSDSLLPSLRTNKEEGQANFVNPGLFLVNGGADFDLTPKLKGVLNVNYLRFMDTQPLEELLFQAPIHNTIGTEYDLGAEYRPPLTENIVIRAGAGALSPGQGFRDIYSSKTLFSVFGDVRFQF
jgi:hypothetical protein